MTLKKRISVGVATVFSVVFALACFIIYTSFAKYRKDEFVDRIKDKAFTTAKLLLDVVEVDSQLLRLIDQNTLYNLLDEKTIVFDDSYNMIYSSLDDEVIFWTKNDLDLLQTENFFYRQVGDKEEVGVHYVFEERGYMIITSANDTYGRRKLEYLLYILLLTFSIGSVLVWSSTWILVKKLLAPLDDFKSQIVEISANKLNHRIKGHTNDELGTLANSFNSMIERLDFAFKSQKEFTANASHELKTPLTRISFQIEGMLENYTHEPEVFNYLTNIKSEVHQMSSLINTLLLLSKIENGERSIDFETLRIDELIFSGFEELKKLDDSYDLQFEIIEGDDSEIEMELHGIKPLIQIAINNLLKNAFQYSSDGIAVVKIVSQETDKLLVVIENKGPIITEKEQTKLFGSFTRGANSQNTKGYGLGLRITKRILELHEAELSYESENPMLNRFIIRFKI